MSLPAKTRLIEELLNPSNRTLAAAATAAGVTAKTARRWRADPAFQAQLDAAISSLLDELAGRMVATMPHAETVLVEAMLDRRTPTSTRVRAAVEFGNLALRLFDTRTILRRLAALEGTDAENP